MPGVNTPRHFSLVMMPLMAGRRQCPWQRSIRRQNAVVLESKEAAGPAHAGLDLIHQHQPVPLGAQLHHSLDIVGIQGQHARPSPCTSLHHDGAHIVAALGLQGGQVIGLGVAGAPR